MRYGLLISFLCVISFSARSEPWVNLGASEGWFLSHTPITYAGPFTSREECQNYHVGLQAEQQRGLMHLDRLQDSYDKLQKAHCMFSKTPPDRRLLQLRILGLAVNASEAQRQQALQQHRR